MCCFKLWSTGRLFWVAALALSLWTAAAAAPETNDAQRVFAGAARLFQGSWYDQAEREFASFLLTFPASTNRDEAALLQAQSRFQLKDYAGVVRLLENRLQTNNAKPDQYLFWLALAQSQLSQFENAAKTYAELLKDHPKSPLRLEASYGEALARFKLGDTARTVELLNDAGSAFVEAAQTSTNRLIVLRGTFLLAEALYAQKNLAAAEKTLTALEGHPLGPEAEWQRQYLLARVAMSDRRGEAALLRVTNLVKIATARSNALLQARSLTLKGEILEEKEPELAAQSYEEITRISDVSGEQKRQALLKLAQLAISQDRLTVALRQLSQFLEHNPQDPAVDLIRFTLGEAYLRAYRAVGTTNSETNNLVSLSANTNLLQLARTQFDLVIGQFTNSVWVGKSLLNRAWCFWEEAQLRNDPTRLLECQKALQTAITVLPKSLEHAQAQFKLADCYLQLKDYPQALTNYAPLLNAYSDVPEVKERLLEQALYQVVRTAALAGNLPAAQNAVERLLREFPGGRWSDHALFAYAQALNDAGDFLKANQAFSDFEKRYAQSPLLPEVRLASAHGSAKQGDWASAIQRFDDWVTHFTNHPARAEAEFDRAWCYYQSGRETNAYTLLTNLVSHFPGTGPAAMAQLWLGDFYLNQRDYASAERSYQFLTQATNSVSPDLIRQAMLMAAKAAFFRQGYPDARKYLMPLVDDPRIGPEAWFMLGDIEIEESRDATNKLAKFEEAINRFARITNFFASSRLAPLAMGKIANCHFQLAAQNTNRYEMATNQYFQLVLAPNADVTTRSQAEVALGQVLERMADQRPNRLELLNAALAHYLNVVYHKRLRSGEDPDPYWVGRAAVAAGTLATERLQRFDEAETLYRTMSRTLPALDSTWTKRLEALRQSRPK